MTNHELAVAITKKLRAAEITAEVEGATTTLGHLQELHRLLYKALVAAQQLDDTLNPGEVTAQGGGTPKEE